MAPLPSRRVTTDPRLALLTLFVPPLLAAGCDDAPRPPSTTIVTRPTATNEPPSPIWPYPTATNDEDDDGPPPNAVGSQVVAGNVRVADVTENGNVAYFKGEIPGKTLELYDTKTKTSRVIVPSTLNADYVLAARNTIALWTGTRGPFGHGTLRFWTATNGLVNVPGSSSLYGIFGVNEDESRVIFANGPGNGTSLGRIVHAPPATAATAQVDIVPSFLTGCLVDGHEHGGRFFVSTCATTERVATARAIGPSGAPLFTHENVKPGVHTSDNGEYAVTVGIAGGATLVTMATGQSTALADVASAEVSHDGTFVVTTTAAGALLRAPTADPTRTETIAASGFTEVLDLSPDGAHAIVATAATTTGRGFEARTSYAMALVSLVAPFTVTSLLATVTGEPRGFTASSKYVLYRTNARSFYADTLVARAVAGGPEITLGTAVSRSYPLAGTNAFVVYQVPRDTAPSAKKVDLDAPAATTILATDIERPVLFDRTLYIGAGKAGLRAVAIP